MLRVKPSWNAVPSISFEGQVSADLLHGLQSAQACHKVEHGSFGRSLSVFGDECSWQVSGEKCFLRSFTTLFAGDCYY